MVLQILSVWNSFVVVVLVVWDTFIVIHCCLCAGTDGPRSVLSFAVQIVCPLKFAAASSSFFVVFFRAVMEPSVAAATKIL